ncbi:MAG: triple tyrosine motif-containing protein [Ginsengibacter sp.]
MTNLKIILLLFLFEGNGLRLPAQDIERFNTFSYNVNEGLLQSTIWDIAFDKNNFCWISFPNGIQKFDGKKFTTVPVQAGLPDDKLSYFFRCSNDELLISHQQGISRYDINNNSFTQMYISDISAKKPAQFIGEDDGIVYIYSANATITGIDCQTYKIVSETKTGFPEYVSNAGYQPKISDNIINHRVTLIINFTLYLWDLKNKKLLRQSAPLPDITPFFLKLKNENEVLYNDLKMNNALRLYNFTTLTERVLPVKGKDDRPIGRCTIFPWQNKIMLSFNNRLYETDSTLQILKTELVNFKNVPVAGSQSITRVKEDNFGNLYLQTVSGGLKKIIRNNYPFKYYSTGKAEDNFVLTILPDKVNNRIFAGTSGNGLLVFDTMQRLVKHIKTLPGQSLPSIINAVVKTAKGSYFLFATGERRIWELSKDLLQLKSIPISTSLPQNKSGISYFANLVFQNDKEAVVQTQNKLFRINFSANMATEHIITNSYTMSGLLFDSSIITHADDELIFLSAGDFNELKRISFKNTGYVRCFAKDKQNVIYVGSNKGIFKIDSNGTILQHLDKKSGLADECIYAMVFDEDGFLWCSTNKGILKINADNSFHQFKKEDGLQENEFNTNAVAKAEDGELFFGGVNGVSSFYSSAIKGFEEKISLIITEIKVNNEAAFTDTAAWRIDKIDLPYNKNSLAFDFIAMANNNPDQYIYQYRMKGVDNEWIQNNSLQTVRYYLPPGNYVFQVFASRSFDTNASAMKEIHIKIHPPFWKTWWFLTGLLFLFITIIAYSINRYNRTRYQRKLRFFETENKMRIERERISRDLHDNIGTYANAVLYNAELLGDENNDGGRRNELIRDLGFASKDIITSLRETVWALKQENYSAEDCLVRIRNFIQLFTRHYPHIKFKVEGDVPKEKILQYNKALHLVRIVQEAVSNATRHADAKNISIFSSAENGHWKLIVIDDGIGFDYKEKKELLKGNGLNNMSQRAVDAGLVFTINSIKGTGSVITIIF